MYQSRAKLTNILPAKIYTAGSRSIDNPEDKISELSFKKYKFNNRPYVSRRNTVIFPAFSEFGSLTLLPVYILPHLMQNRYAGKFSCVATWSGLRYLFENVVDEVWELDNEYGYLKEYCRAFHHDSFTLKKCEKFLAYHGNVASYNEYTQFALNELYKNIDEYKQKAVWLKRPSEDKVKRIREIIQPNSVGIFNRARKTYGRNLPSDFYIKLINMLKSMGYSPIWLGDRNTMIENPDKSILDFNSLPESKDIEYTFALAKELKFGIQWYTAASRICTMQSVPTILFESDQQVIPGLAGQEHFRLKLLNQGEKLKLVIGHYHSVVERPDVALAAAEQAIREIEQNNYNIFIPEGLVLDKNYVEFLLNHD